MLQRLVPFFLLLLVLQPFSAQALEVPKRAQGYVTDRANMIAPATENKLEAALAAFEGKTSNQIVVVTFPSLEGESLEDFSIQLAEAWKVGQKGKDNGVIFLIFKEDRKMRIEVGYGLEGVIPDALAGQIISQIVTPSFKQGKFEDGILGGVAALMKASEGEFKGVASYGRNRYRQRRPMTPAERAAAAAKARALMIFVMIAFGILFLVDGGRYLKYRRQHRVYKQSYSFWEWFFRFAVVLAVLSILWRILFYTMLFSRGGYSGGSGGGGFSGGGGGFGGGGAGGSW